MAEAPGYRGRGMRDTPLRLGILVALASVVTVAAVLVRPAAALAPGPWKVMAQGTKSGRLASVFVRGRWSYVDEYGPASGVAERWPIPKNMAFVVTETPRQAVHVSWSALCYPNGERAAPSQGTNHGIGTLTIYPTLYKQRVECDPYVVARLAKRGTIRVRIYAY
jgi:hypothetical protein